MDHSADVSANADAAESENIVELRAEIQKLKNRLRGANQAREQVRLQNVFVASLQAELTAAKAEISSLQAELQTSRGQDTVINNENRGSASAITVPSDVSGTPAPTLSSSAAAQSDLEQTNKELLDMCAALESELEREQKEYDNLSQLYTTALSEQKAQREAWEREMETLKKADLNQELELKTFQLSKEKEVVAQLQNTVTDLRREMERAKQKQHLREKTINENYEEAMEQLREDRVRLQEEVDRLQRSLQNEHPSNASATGTPGSGGSHSIDAEPHKEPPVGASNELAPMRDAEREAYAILIHHLQMEIVELRRKGFIAVRRAPSVGPSGGSVATGWHSSPHDYPTSLTTTTMLDKELEWIDRELLGYDVGKRTLPEGCVKVLNFADPTSRVISSRAMFSVPTNFIDGNWF